MVNQLCAKLDRVIDAKNDKSGYDPGIMIVQPDWDMPTGDSLNALGNDKP